MVQSVWCIVHGALCMVPLRGIGAGAHCTLSYLTIRSYEVELFMARGSKTGGWCMVQGAWCMVHGAWCMVPLRGIGAGAQCTLNYHTIRSFEAKSFMVRGSKTGRWCMVQGA